MNELQAHAEMNVDQLRRFAEHLASEAIGSRCELVAHPGKGSRDGRCAGQAVAIKWEDGFADDVCIRHATTASDRGAIVIYPKRHNGEEGGTDER